MRKYDIYESKRKVVGLFLLALFVELLFLIIVMSTLSSQEPNFIVGFLFGALAFVVLIVLWKVIKKMITRKPAIILEPEYITIINNPKYPVKIALEDVYGVLPYAIQGQRYLGIVMEDDVEDRYIASIPSKGKRLYRVNKRAGFIPFNIHLNLLKIDGEVLLEKLYEYDISFLIPEDEAR
ncbi:STM3941 family protein [Bacillus cereus]|uniref:STM3941 family protein n=1 Tax=Bacillus cereus TaxID=1396 RepID=UPI00397F4752